VITFVNGETMVYVKGNVASAIPSLSELGLSESPIVITPTFKHKPIVLDAWGSEVPAEIQFKLSYVTVSMNLIHFDRTVLSAVIMESMGGALTEGTLTRAGTRLGNNAARFALNNHFIGLNLSSPVAGIPYRFLSAFLTDPLQLPPMGTEKSITPLTFQCIAYQPDPYNSAGGGTGAYGAVIFDHTLDT